MKNRTNNAFGTCFRWLFLLIRYSCSGFCLLSAHTIYAIAFFSTLYVQCFALFIVTLVTFAEFSFCRSVHRVLRLLLFSIIFLQRACIAGFVVGEDILARKNQFIFSHRKCTIAILFYAHKNQWQLKRDARNSRAQTHLRCNGDKVRVNINESTESPEFTSMQHEKTRLLFTSFAVLFSLLRTIWSLIAIVYADRNCVSLKRSMTWTKRKKLIEIDSIWRLKNQAILMTK